MPSDRSYRAPVLLLTTTGRKSGAQRTAPVVHLADGERMGRHRIQCRRMNDPYAGFDDYRIQTARDISVFVLEPRWALSRLLAADVHTTGQPASAPRGGGTMAVGYLP